MNPGDADMLDDVEAALRSLQPARHTLDADRIIFEAGCAQGAKAAHRWRGAAGAMAVMLAASLLLHVPGGSQEPAPRQMADAVSAPLPVEIEHTEVPAAPPPSQADAQGLRRYHALRQRVLEQGLDALHTVATRPDSARQTDELADIKRLLDRPVSPTATQEPLPWWVHLMAGEAS